MALRRERYTQWSGWNGDPRSVLDGIYLAEKLLRDTPSFTSLIFATAKFPNASYSRGGTVDQLGELEDLIQEEGAPHGITLSTGSEPGCVVQISADRDGLSVRTSGPDQSTVDRIHNVIKATLKETAVADDAEEVFPGQNRLAEVVETVAKESASEPERAPREIAEPRADPEPSLRPEASVTATGPAKVERQNDPVAVDRWAATRNGFADFIRRVVELVEAPDERVHVRIDVPGYERSFESAEEFLDHVESDEWRDLKQVSGTVIREWRSTPAPLSVYFGFGVPPRHTQAYARTGGGTRKERNAIEPDIRVALLKNERAEQHLPWIHRGLAQNLIPFLVALPGAVAGVGISLLAGLHSWAGTALGIGITILVAAPVMSRVTKWNAAARRSIKRVEFLPDDGVSQFEAFSERDVSLRTKVYGTVGWVISIGLGVAGLLK